MFRKIASLSFVAALALMAAFAASAAGNRTSSGTLVIDTSSQLRTLDPGHELETTGSFVVHQMYDTLVTFPNGSAKKVIPNVARAWRVAKNKQYVTFYLRKNIRFSDGSPLTSADVVFSLDRLKNMAGNPAFLMQGLQVVAPSKYVVVVSAGKPDPTLLARMAAPQTGVLNAKVVQAQGGTDAANAASTDKAESYLDTNSAGSGPYELVNWTRGGDVTLKANPYYWGKKPSFTSVVIHSATGSVQRLDIQRGAAQLVLDLSAADADGLSGLHVIRAHTADIFWLFSNGNPAVSKIASNPKFQEAVRYGVDYNGLLQLAGSGAQPLAGIVSPVFNGALPAKDAIRRNLARAKQALAASGIADPTVHLYFPSDVTVDGLSFGDLATRVQQNLKDVGINVVLEPQPTQTALVGYRAGTEEMGLWETGPSIPMENNQLVWLPGLPGNYMAVRAGWDKVTVPAITQLGKDAAVQLNAAKRAKLWQRIQLLMQNQSPIIPLFAPAKVLVAAKNLKGVAYNLGWMVDIAALH